MDQRSQYLSYAAAEPASTYMAYGVPGESLPADQGAQAMMAVGPISAVLAAGGDVAQQQVLEEEEQEEEERDGGAPDNSNARDAQRRHNPYASFRDSSGHSSASSSRPYSAMSGDSSSGAEEEDGVGYEYDDLYAFGDDITADVRDNSAEDLLSISPRAAEEVLRSFGMAIGMKRCLKLLKEVVQMKGDMELRDKLDDALSAVKKQVVHDIAENGSTRDTDWDERLMRVKQGSDDHRTMLRRLEAVRMEFEHQAQMVGELIISEKSLPPYRKSIKPLPLGGIAGGEKFIVNGILYKFSHDVRLNQKLWLYGGAQRDDEAARKAAGHELKATSAIYKALMENHIAKIRSPYMMLVDYRGFRLSCQALAPIGGSDTLVYGSRDAAYNLATGERMESVLPRIEQLSNALRLSRHGVREARSGVIKDLWMPADIEVHRSTDVDNDTCYVIDTARLLPPMRPSSANPREVFYKLFRVEFMRWYDRPLSSDAFSRFGASGVKEHNAAVAEATRVLLEERIPAVAKQLRAGHITRQLQQFGVNVRLIGVVRHYVEDAALRHELLVEMTARIIKKEINQQWRTANGATLMSRVKVAVQMLNRFVRQATLRETNSIKVAIGQKFGPLALTAEEKGPQCLLRHHIRETLVLLQRVAELSGIVLADSVNDDNAPLTNSDVTLQSRVKELTIAAGMKAEALRQEAKERKAKRKGALLERAFDIYAAELVSDPHDVNKWVAQARVVVDQLTLSTESDFDTWFELWERAEAVFSHVQPTTPECCCLLAKRDLVVVKRTLADDDANVEEALSWWTKAYDSCKRARQLLDEGASQQCGSRSDSELRLKVDKHVSRCIGLLRDCVWAIRREQDYGAAIEALEGRLTALRRKTYLCWNVTLTGLHAQSFWLLVELAERGDEEAERLACSLLAQHGEGGLDIKRLRVGRIGDEHVAALGRLLRTAYSAAQQQKQEEVTLEHAEAGGKEDARGREETQQQQQEAETKEKQEADARAGSDAKAKQQPSHEGQAESSQGQGDDSAGTEVLVAPQKEQKKEGVTWLDLSHSLHLSSAGLSSLLQGTVAPRITRLELRDCVELGAGLPRALQGATALRYLDVTGFLELTDEVAAQVVHAVRGSVEQLLIGNCPLLTGRLFEGAEPMPHVQRLELGGCARLQHLSGITPQRFPALKRVGLRACVYLSSNEMDAWAATEMAKQVEWLDISATALPGELSAQQQWGFCKLRVLDVSESEMRGKALVPLAKRNAETLQVLRVRSCAHVTSGQLCKALQHTAQLRELDVTGNQAWQLSERDIDLPRLRNLHVLGTRVTEAVLEGILAGVEGQHGGFRRVSVSCLNEKIASRIAGATLEELVIEGAEFTPPIWDVMLGSGVGGKLRTLALHKCDGVEDAAFARLLSKIGPNVLESLSLRGLDLTGEALLQRSEVLRELRSLRLESCNFSSGLLGGVVAGLPRLERLFLSQAGESDGVMRRVVAVCRYLSELELCSPYGFALESCPTAKTLANITTLLRMTIKHARGIMNCCHFFVPQLQRLESLTFDTFIGDCRDMLQELSQHRGLRELCLYRTWIPRDVVPLLFAGSLQKTLTELTFSCEDVDEAFWESIPAMPRLQVTRIWTPVVEEPLNIPTQYAAKFPLLWIPPAQAAAPDFKKVRSRKRIQMIISNDAKSQPVAEDWEKYAVACVDGSEFGEELIRSLRRKHYFVFALYTHDKSGYKPSGIRQQRRILTEELGVVWLQVARKRASDVQRVLEEIGKRTSCIDLLLPFDYQAWEKRPSARGNFGTIELENWHRTFEHIVHTPLFWTAKLREMLVSSDDPRVLMVVSPLGSQAENASGRMLSLRAASASLMSSIRALDFEFKEFGGIIMGVHVGLFLLGAPAAWNNMSSSDAARAVVGAAVNAKPEHSGKLWRFPGWKAIPP